MCATVTSGDVLFFTKPLPSSLYNPKASSSKSATDFYVCQTLVKQNVHQGDLYAVTANETFIAVGGMDNKISYWSAFTGSFKSYTKLPPLGKEENTSEVYIVGLQFLEKHGSFVLAL